MSPLAKRVLTSPVLPGAAQTLIGQPLDLRRIVLSDAAVMRCARLDELLQASAAPLRSSDENADGAAVSLVLAGKLDLHVPGPATPVRFAAKPALEVAIAARPIIAACNALSAALGARSLTPRHLRLAHVAATGMPLLPFRIGQHHLAADADGIAVIFPPTDCARVLAGLCAWLNAGPALPPAAQALIAYLQIVKLHAFHDGNGRLARVLLSAVLAARSLRADGLFLPLAAVIFANAEFLSAEYRRATDARQLDDFILYAATLVERALQAALAVAADKAMLPQQTDKE